MATSRAKRLLDNAFSLSALQFINYLAPILLLPYLTRTLGVEEFGAVMLALAAVTLAYVVTDFGFGLSATYRIAKKRSDCEYISHLIARIFSAKVVLVAVALLILMIVAQLPPFYDYRHVFFYGGVAIVAQAYQPIWLFHGLERMRSYASYMALTKIAYVGLVLSLVTEQGDAWLVLLSWSIAHSLGTVFSFLMMFRLGYGFGFSGVRESMQELRESAQFFWSRIAVSLYTSMSSLIVGMAGLQQAAIYASAEQGYRAGQAVTSSVAQAMYPYMARERDWALFFKVLFSVTALLVIGATVVSYFSQFFITLIFGDSYLDAAPVLVIMMLTLVVNYLGVSMGYPALAAMGKVEWANRTVMIAAALFGITLVGLYALGEISAVNVALMVLLTESVVLLLRLLIIAKG